MRTLTVNLAKRQTGVSKKTIAAFLPAGATLDMDDVYRRMTGTMEQYPLCTRGSFKGIVMDMATAIRQLLLEGYKVKIPDLCICSLAVSKTESLTDIDSFDPTQLRLKMKLTPTGKTMPRSLNEELTDMKFDIRIRAGNGKYVKLKSCGLEF